MPVPCRLLARRREAPEANRAQPARPCAWLHLGAVACALAAASAAGAVHPGPVKRLVHTSWWPPGNDKWEEAVGVVSRGVLYATGMMEPQTPPKPYTFNISRDVLLELEDIRDIAAAGDSSLASLVDCVVNVPRGSAAVAREALRGTLAPHVPAVTVLETQGEDPTFNSSATCYGVVESGGLTPVRRASPRPGVDAASTADGAMAWLSYQGSAARGAVAVAVDDALRSLGGVCGSADLVDCTAFVPPAGSGGGERRAEAARDTVVLISSGGGMSPSAALTVVETGLGEGVELRLRCTALAGAAKTKRRVRPAGAEGVATVVAGGVAYVDGVGGQQANATDAFAAVAASLEAAGSRMSLMVNTLFFVASEAGIDPLFAGFSRAFNTDFPPPPSRTEFVGASPAFQCHAGAGGRCPVVAKCIAAVP